MTIRVAKNALAAHGGSVEGLPGFEGLSAKDRQAVQRTFGQVLKEDTKAAAVGGRCFHRGQIGRMHVLLSLHPTCRSFSVALPHVR